MNRLALVGALLFFGGAAMAQQTPAANQQRPAPPFGGGFPGGGPGGPGGPGGFGGGPMMGGPQQRTVTVASVPLRAFVTYVGLTDVQIGKIALAREAMQDSLRPPMPSGRDGDAGRPEPPEGMDDPGQAAEQSYRHAIAAVLTAPQRIRLATLVKALQTLQTVRIRPEAAINLKLTATQLTQLAALHQNATASSVDLILTQQQRSVAKDYSLPSFPPGGFGEGGGPGFGGPPPPGEGG